MDKNNSNIVIVAIVAIVAIVVLSIPDSERNINNQGLTYVDMATAGKAYYQPPSLPTREPYQGESCNEDNDCTEQFYCNDVGASCYLFGGDCELGFCQYTFYPNTCGCNSLICDNPTPECDPFTECKEGTECRSETCTCESIYLDKCGECSDDGCVGRKLGQYPFPSPTDECAIGENCFWTGWFCEIGNPGAGLMCECSEEDPIGGPDHRQNDPVG